MRQSFKAFVKYCTTIPPGMVYFPPLHRLVRDNRLHGRAWLALAYLMRLQIVLNPLDGNDGWFKCSDNDIKIHTNFPKGISRVLHQLKLIGLIKIKLVGKPPIRHVWIDHDFIAAELESAHAEFELMKKEMQDG